MSNNGNSNGEYNNLLSSVISDVKSYNGSDPLLPWLRGIRKMKDTLPSQLLKQKLPRFLQKCSQTFIANRRYSNDLRYLRVWLQLMDHVDDPKSVLRTMEENRIGMKKSLFYQAYALYYEKRKKFDAAEKIYHLGVQNFAEPADELQKSYEQFLHRLERHNNKRVQLKRRKTNIRRLNQDEFRGCKENSNRTDDLLPQKEVEVANIVNKTVPSQSFCNNMPMQKANHKQMAEKPSNMFVDDAPEDARHHGLVEPTINTKEAMDAINNMFREPLKPSMAGRTSKSLPKVGNNSKNVITVFTDERVETNKRFDECFEIYVDDEEANDVDEKVESNSNSVFARPNDLPFECVKDSHPRRLLREDTIVSRFVSTISDDPKVENVWHHGLVDPTVNLKEAMDDINNMFGEPIEFARKSRPKKHEKAPDVKRNCGEFVILADDELDDKKAEDSGFLILPDDELDNQQDSSLPSASTGKGSDLFEQTLCTKEAMDEINKLFSMPMDF